MKYGQMIEKKKVTLSFSGCGFLGIYHVGVASCFREFEEYFQVEKVAGASAGAIAAASYLCGVCLGRATTDVLNIARAARASPVGPLSPRFNLVKIIRDGLSKVLPENAHQICSGRLCVSLTRCHDGKNLIVSEFASKEELIQVLICSSFVPFYSGLVPPFYKDARYWDGGITNNLPLFDDATITISPFSGESDICPADKSAAFLEINFSNHNFRMNAKNVYRMSRALFPPHPEALSEICREGYQDALRYIKTVLLADEFSLPLPHRTEEFMSEHSPAAEINSPLTNSLISITSETTQPIHNQLARQHAAANAGTLPTLVADAIREACVGPPHPVMRALSYATLPWVLPLEFMYSTCLRLIEIAPRPRTMELENFVEIFCSVAQRVAVRLLNRHGSHWLKCYCNLESVKMFISSDRKQCVVHGQGAVNQTNTVTFAFAMSIEEPRTNSQENLETVCGEAMECLPAINDKSELERHPGEIKLILEDAFNYDEVIGVLNKHDNEIVDYFQELIRAPQPALILSKESESFALPDLTNVEPDEVIC